MKVTILVATALMMLAALVSAQSDPAACTLCLQKALQAFPACAGVQAPTTPGQVSPAYAACLCASLSGAWIDSCASAAQCGSSINSFKASYATNIQAAGLSCAGNKAAFNPPA
ncbi:hypothetical protein EDD11_010185 [Mortierella claussenii]|nr:hypothetical protein EDD11_010185 [Mortierella claussenii]